jgi:hypothetical protein
MFNIVRSFTKFFLYLKNCQIVILTLHLNLLELKFIQYLVLKMTALFESMLTLYIIPKKTIFCLKLTLK